uniref:Fibronectin type-III domain-containing protein n=1 Tax=Aureoumbra lagunensis TaxID=44058 RepID=A0A7S3K2Y7_9STRA|mmetsp:Transcript_7885/g.10987  ORF Transcript_7885/g.10987 Transcript_7885/m.10987 type:complete len:864 (-) Transcript_7885:142-2733(-)|eukprot:CAMPEP_0197290844 /NCGR_PEP_ID=MMETSP0890-20130614/10255_1 /TAXON_ID=44058 ORGANISM="Aureoumbra lagunensis, Strain CCMP1510" /NCGR_SAMPLE_ID=MMETSP0890 /ASSEMBLY_ACC=CAM_ASM_000533 /LENGTH=863 /DNA_ID=CAMNT_0042763177 /DNA_START=151 /DNA_END=2742 /DNA_ORIENTATION=-
MYHSSSILQKNTRVRLCGLHNEDYNGKYGVIVEKQAAFDSHRYVIALDDGREVSIKAQNLEHLGTAITKYAEDIERPPEIVTTIVAQSQQEDNFNEKNDDDQQQRSSVISGKYIACCYAFCCCLVLLIIAIIAALFIQPLVNRNGGSSSSDDSTSAPIQGTSTAGVCCTWSLTYAASFEPNTIIASWLDSDQGSVYEFFYKDHQGILKSINTTSSSIELSGLIAGDTYSVGVSVLGDGLPLLSNGTTIDVTIATIAPELDTGVIVVSDIDDADASASLSLDGNTIIIDASLLKFDDDGTILVGPSFIVRRTSDWNINNNVATSTVVNASIREAFSVLEYDATGDAFDDFDDTNPISRGRKLNEVYAGQKVFSTSDTQAFGPVTLENIERLKLYVRVRMKWTEDDDNDNTNIIVDTSASYTRELSLTFENGISRQASKSIKLWEGPKFRVPLPPPLRVIVNLSVEPKFTLEATASITLEATATMSVTATGSAVATVIYDDGDFDATGSLRMKFERDADLRAEAEASADISVSLEFEVEMFHFFELEIAIVPSIEWVAETSIEPLVSDDIRLDTFDLVAKVAMLASGEIDIPILGEFSRDLGSLFNAEYVLITLPELILEQSGPFECIDDIPTIRYQVLVDGGDEENIIEPHEWDFVDTYSQVSDWSISPDGLEAQLRYTPQSEPPLQTPTGTILFKTTPTIPSFPNSLIVDTELTASREFECCTPADCGENEELYSCENALCLHKGNPRFTLSWAGDDDLDLHVMTPSGYEIYYGAPFDDTGGQLDHDDIPESYAFWNENIFWPDDGTAPPGIYTYFVHNYDLVDSADRWTIKAYRGDELVAEHSGILGDNSYSTYYTLDTSDD